MNAEEWKRVRTDAGALKNVGARVGRDIAISQCIREWDVRRETDT